MSNMKKQTGFTLIELMIVIAIVAILVALAVPAYKDYTIRAKVTECVNGAAVAKLQISEFRETVGRYPTSEDEAGTASPAGVSQFCEGFTYDAGNDGTFRILINEQAIDAQLVTDGITLEPQMYAQGSGQGGVNWYCQIGNTTATAVKYLPSTCRGPNS